MFSRSPRLPPLLSLKSRNRRTSRVSPSHPDSTLLPKMPESSKETWLSFRQLSLPGPSQKSNGSEKELLLKTVLTIKSRTKTELRNFWSEIVTRMMPVNLLFRPETRWEHPALLASYQSSLLPSATGRQCRTSLKFMKSRLRRLSLVSKKILCRL